MQIPFTKTADGIVIQVRVQPRSSTRGISGVAGNTVTVRLTSAPVDGAANKQLIEVLSETFHVSKSSLRIVRGVKSRTKLIEIKGIREPGDIHI